MVVENISGRDLEIVELNKILPFDGKQRVLPYQLAVKYKEFLKPIQMSDTPPPAYNVINNRKYKATVVEINLDDIIAEDIQQFQPPKELQESILTQLKVFHEQEKKEKPLIVPAQVPEEPNIEEIIGKAEELRVKPLTGKKINKKKILANKG
jgi:hypothetical protein